MRPDRLEKYRRRHAAVWPEMLVALRDAGWHDYSLFVGDDGLLVGVFRTEDLDAARAALDATEVNASGSARWPRSSSTCPPGAPDTGIRVLDEVFDLDSQPARIAAAPG